MMMLELYICLIASFHFHTFSLCMSYCDKGFYGPNCAFNCSANCRQGMCRMTDAGIEECTDGCKPGFYGSRCKVPCRKPSAWESCKKCPRDCENGFCELGDSCRSGCANHYYGYNCTCEITTGCNSGCGEDCPEKTSFKVYYYVAGGVGGLVLVQILGCFIYLSHRRKSYRVMLSRGNETEST